MIQTFADPDTETLFQTSRQWKDKAHMAVRRLQALDFASAVEDFKSPPGNSLEQLKQDRKGQWSIRINERFRICFRWDGADAWDVEIVDDH